MRLSGVWHGRAIGRTGVADAASSARAGVALAAAALLVSGCSSGGDGPGTSSGSYDPKWGVSSSPRIVADASQPIPRGGGVYKVGNPYQVGGRWYYPRHEPYYNATGVASWYGPGFHGRKTANGEVFDMHALTAAHKTLPMPSYAYVTNLNNGRTILVRINDRGPYVSDRIIDLSKAAADALGYGGAGLVNVRVRYAGQAPLDGNDGRERRFIASQPWWNGRERVASELPPVRTPRPEWMDTGPGRAYASGAYAPTPSPRPVPQEGWSPFAHRWSTAQRSGLGATQRSQ